MLDVRPASAHDWVSLVQCSLRSGSELISGENISSNLAKSVFILASKESSFGSTVLLEVCSVEAFADEVVATGLDTTSGADTVLVFNCWNSFNAPLDQFIDILDIVLNDMNISEIVGINPKTI